MHRIGSLVRCESDAHSRCSRILGCMARIKGICVRWSRRFKAQNVPADHSLFEKAIEDDHVLAGALTRGMQRLRVYLLARSTRTILVL